MNRLGCVYEIVNLVNGRRYIGSSTEFETRWATHRRELSAGRHINGHLQAAWNKYGAAAFEFRTIWICSFDRMLEAEQSYIKEARSPYNLTDVVGRPDFSGRSHSPESRARMRLAAKARKPISEETREKMAEAHRKEWAQGRHPKGWHHSYSAKHRIAIASKARCAAGFLPPRPIGPLSIEHRAKIAAKLVESHRRRGHRIQQQEA